VSSVHSRFSGSFSGINVIRLSLIFQFQSRVFYSFV